MNFLELLQPQGDKADLNEIIEVKKLLPASVTKSIPACLYDDNDDLDEEVLCILSLIRAKRENADITLSEIGERIGNSNPELINPIIKELIFFYTTNTRAEVDDRFAEAEVEADDETVVQEVEEVATDPIP